MDQTIKKKLARNWFKTLQEVICQEIEELEGKKNIFKIKNWERGKNSNEGGGQFRICLLYTSPSPRDGLLSRMPSSA